MAGSISLVGSVSLHGFMSSQVYLLSLQLDVVPCGGRKSLPALIFSADYILLLVL